MKLSAEKIPPRKVLQLKLQSSDATILLVFSHAKLELECIINSSTFAMRLLQNFTRYMINHWILMDTGFVVYSLHSNFGHLENFSHNYKKSVA